VLKISSGLIGLAEKPVAGPFPSTGRLNGSLGFSGMGFFAEAIILYKFAPWLRRGIGCS
jgi:hypothetical protein